MRSLIVVAVLLALVSVASSRTILQYWYTDMNCTQDLNIVKVEENKCYYDTPDYTGLKWTCDESRHYVIAKVFNVGDPDCTGEQIGTKEFPPKQCVGPIYGDMFLIASGC